MLITTREIYYVLERPNETSPLCVDVDLKFKESTTQRYTNWHIESIDNMVTEVIKPLNDCYVFEKPERTKGGTKNGSWTAPGCRRHNVDIVVNITPII